MTETASIARSVLWLSPSVSSTYSCGRFTSTAAMVMMPVRMRSRMRSRVRKSSPSFLSAILYCPPYAPHSRASPAPCKRLIWIGHVEGICQGIGGRRRRAGGPRTRLDRQKLHLAHGIRAAESGVEEARRARASRSGEDGRLGGRARRSLRERRLYLWQEAPARDRPAGALPHQAPGSRRSRAVGRPRDRPGLLRRDRPLQVER